MRSLFVAGLLVAMVAAPVRGQIAPVLLEDSVNSVPHRIVRSYRILSAALGEERRVAVHFPASYFRASADRRYPVAVVFDGETLGQTVATVATELARNGQIPEMLVVGVENTGRTARLDANQKRVWDLTPPGLSVSGSDRRQAGDLMLDFVEHELLEAVDQRLLGGSPKVLIGHSSGGILATYAAATRARFDVVLSLDAPVSLQEGWLVNRLTEAANESERPLRYATIGARFEWPDDGWDSLTKVAPKGWQLLRRHLPEERHQTMTMLGSYLGLRDVFADHPTRVAEQERVLQEANARPGSVTVASLLATPFATPDEAAQFVGEWTGSVWMGDERPVRDEVRLRLRVVDGRLVGETEQPRPGVAPLVRRWEYLRISPRGMTWGFMNGMEPRALALFEGTLEGEELSGLMRLSGLPDATDTGPPLKFSFRRTSASKR
ncbi:MAG: alpha/beta fold hydrolase [Gemmatimonadaceae bacterium]|nr:alpha/beta fold hydrolase [Gemmatimonadaceae bacterium]